MCLIQPEENGSDQLDDYVTVEDLFQWVYVVVANDKQFPGEQSVLKAPPYTIVRNGSLLFCNSNPTCSGGDINATTNVIALVLEERLGNY